MRHPPTPSTDTRQRQNQSALPPGTWLADWLTGSPHWLRPLKDLRDKGIFATRQLAKRQITWLRANRQRQVVACDAPDAVAQVLTLARAFICNPA